MKKNLLSRVLKQVDIFEAFLFYRFIICMNKSII